MPFRSLSSLYKPYTKPFISVIVTSTAGAPKQHLGAALSAQSHILGGETGNTVKQQQQTQVG